MSPPGLSKCSAPGGSWNTDKGRQRDAAITAAHRALNESGVIMSPSKVARMIAKFDHALKRGCTFHEFLVRETSASAASIRRLVAHPEWHRVIAYADPTGETAVNRVMRECR